MKKDNLLGLTNFTDTGIAIATYPWPLKGDNARGRDIAPNAPFRDIGRNVAELSKCLTD